VTALLREGYAFRKRRWLLLIKAVDFFVALFVFCAGKKNTPAPGKPRKILISQLAHLGDVVLALALIEPLKRRYPDAEIHFLCGSWAEPLLKGNPHIKSVIAHDSFFLQRDGNAWQKFSKAICGFRAAAKRLREEKIDLALDCRIYFPNSLPLLYAGQCRCICAYPTAGYGALADIKPDFVEDAHEAQRSLNLLAALGAKREEPAEPDLSYLVERGDAKFLADAGLAGKKYIVLQPGSASKARMFPAEYWAGIIGVLANSGQRIVITGAGSEVAAVKEIIELLPVGNRESVNNLCGQTGLNELALLFKNAALVLGVNSFACHLAGTLGCRTVVVFSGIVDERHWRPLGNVRVIKAAVPCSPCYRKNGCESMECVKAITPDEITAAAIMLLRD
jgi:ADP-heptose:LPS heptosyltransferase